MKSYRGIITAELLALVLLLLLVSKRAQTIWAAVLGQATAMRGTPPPQAQVLTAQFTPVGLALAAFLAIRFGKGTAGVVIAGALGAVLLGTVLLQYRAVESVLFVRPQASTGGAKA